MSDFSRAFFKTCAQANLNVLSDEYCVELLAWLYVYGGSCEAVIYNELMTGHIVYAQTRFNVNGGEIPSEYLVTHIKPLVKEAEAMIKDKTTKLKQYAPDWAWRIVDKYNIQKFPFDRVPEIPATQQLELF